FLAQAGRRGADSDPDDLAFLDALLAYGGTRLRIARDRADRAVGFSVVLPVCRRSLPVLQRSPVLAPRRAAYLAGPGTAALPECPEAARAFVVLHLAHLDAPLEAVRAALLRDWLGVLALGGTYLVATPIALYERALEALGFQRVAGA